MTSIKLWFLMCAALGAGCGSDEPDIGTSLQALGASGTTTVIGTVWERSTIAVCWTEDGGPMGSSAAAGYADDLDWIEALIHGAWEPIVGVRFTFERDCMADYDVSLDVHGNQGLGYGRELRGLPPLGIDLTDWGEAPADRHARLRSEAMLASGRLLGLEWTPPDDGDPCATPFRRGCSDTSPLAPSAVRAAIAQYGVAAGAFVTPAGQCLYSVWLSRKLGVKQPRVQDCGVNAALALEPGAPGYFLVDASGLPLGRWAHDSLLFGDDPDADTMFFPRLAEYRTIGGRCLTEARPDDPLPSVRTCDGGDDQQYFGRGIEYCFAPEAETVGGVRQLELPGATVEQVPCGDAAYQTWYLTADDTLVNGLSGFCLTQPDGGVEGGHLTSAPCEALTSQRFTTHALIEEDWYLGWRFSVGAPLDEVDHPTVVRPEPAYDQTPPGVSIEHRRYAFRATTW